MTKLTQSNSIPQPAVIPYHLKIGVTGHRDLKNPDNIQKKVTEVIDKIEQSLDFYNMHPQHKCCKQPGKRYILDWILLFIARIFWWSVPIPKRTISNDKQTPIIWEILSPLAQGADQIVAESILKNPLALLTVLLPFNEQEYLQYFVDQDNKEAISKGKQAQNKFNELIGRAQSVIELSPDKEPNQKQLTDLSVEQRDRGYKLAGEKIVDLSEIIIAIWDGKELDGVGTGATVVDAINKNRIVIWIDATNPEQSAWLINSGNIEQIDKGSENEFKQTLLNKESNHAFIELKNAEDFPPNLVQVLSNNFHQLAAYNRDSAVSTEQYEEAYRSHFVAKEKNTKGGDFVENFAGVEGISEKHLTSLKHFLLPQYVKADTSALRYQQLYTSAAKWMFYLSAFAVTVAVGQLLFAPNAVWLIGFEILSMLAVLLMLQVGVSDAWHKKWLHDRHLAERLRIAMFSCLKPNQLPISNQHGYNADKLKSSSKKTLPFYRGPDNWVMDAFDWIMYNCPDYSLSVKHHGVIVKNWLKNQADYHTSNALSKESQAEKNHKLGLGLFTLTLVMAILHFIGIGHSDSMHLLGLIITFLAIVLPAWGAAVHAINHMLEYQRIAERSKRMSSILNSMVKRVDEAIELAENDEQAALTRIVNLAVEAEQVMSTENHEWCISLSFKGLVLPA